MESKVYDNKPNHITNNLHTDQRTVSIYRTLLYFTRVCESCVR